MSNYWGGGWPGSYFPLAVDDGVEPLVNLLFPITLSVSADDDPSVTLTFDLSLSGAVAATGIVGTSIKHRSETNPDAVVHQAP